MNHLPPDYNPLLGFVTYTLYQQLHINYMIIKCRLFDVIQYCGENWGITNGIL